MAEFLDDWRLLDEDPLRGIRRYVRYVGKDKYGEDEYAIQVRQKIDPIMEANEEQAKAWAGWGASENKNGAICARIPDTEYTKIMKLCGFQEGQYDRKRFAKIMNDGDYAKFRTGGGRLG